MAMPEGDLMPMTRWILGTLAWVAASCAAVAVIWGPSPYAIATTALASIAISAVLGNGFER